MKLEFSPEGRSVSKLRAEIVVGPGPWRYSRARTVSGAPVTVSAKEQRRPEGQQSKAVVVLLTISSRKQAIPSGTVAELVFTRSGERSGDRNAPDANDHPVLEIRKVEVEFFGKPQDTRAPLEPPTAEPPANPVPTCFFFTH